MHLSLAATYIFSFFLDLSLHSLILHLNFLVLFVDAVDDWEPGMNLKMEWQRVANKRNAKREILSVVYLSVVEKVEDDFEDAAKAGGHSDPQVDLISFGMGDVFLGLCS